MWFLVLFFRGHPDDVKHGSVVQSSIIFYMSHGVKFELQRSDWGYYTKRSLYFKTFLFLTIDTGKFAFVNTLQAKLSCCRKTYKL